MNRPTNTPNTGKKTLANSLVALSSAAVIAVYAAGYARTAPAAGQFIATEAVSGSSTAPAPLPPPPAAPTATSTATAAPANPASGDNQGIVQGGGRQRTGGAESGGGIVASIPTTTATATAASSAPTTAVPAVTNAAFRDGTYTGTGTSRHGNIGVTVTVQAGKIIAAEITNCGTRYPCSEIAALPGQIIARQGAAVDAVTGATDSTNAYRAAVNAALAQAR